MAEVHPKFDAEARFAQVEERVTNLSSRFSALEQSTTHGFATAAAQINTLGTEMRSAIGSLAQEIRQGQRTPWATIWSATGVAFTVLVGVGYLAYTPLVNSVTDLKTAQTDIAKSMAEIPKDYVSKDVAQILRERTAEDRDRNAAALESLEKDKASRREIDQLLTRVERLEEHHYIPAGGGAH